jgi:hypothetical protein
MGRSRKWFGLVQRTLSKRVYGTVGLIMYIIDLKDRTVAESTKQEVSGFAIFQEKNKKNKSWQDRFILIKDKIEAKKLILKLMKKGF